MGILLEIMKNGEVEMQLTEYSVKGIDFASDTDIAADPRHNDITREIIVTGVINPETITERAKLKTDDFGYPIGDGNEYELREIDSVRMLANWAVMPEYSDCYRDGFISLTNAMGTLVKTESFHNLYVADYHESFNDNKGHGDFSLRLREREVRLEGLNEEQAEGKS